MSASELPSEMQEVAEAVGDATDKRYDYEIAADIKIDERTLRRWKHCPGFREIEQKSLEESKSSLRVTAYKSLHRQVIAENMAAVKEALDRTEGSVKQKHDHSGAVDLEVVHKYVDP